MPDNKTCIITTYHKSLSYGGCLQAYATQVLVESFGIKVSFLDYENSFEARQKSGKLSDMSSLAEAIKTGIKRLVFKNAQYQKKAFSSFHAMIPKTPREYSDLSEMRDIEADVLLVASDQVWNPDITNGIERVFLLAFGNDDMRRVSFASSMGSHSLTTSEKDVFAHYLPAFDAISVREGFAKSQLQDLTSDPIEICMDPTLQLSSEFWTSKEAVVQSYEKMPFILLFVVSSDEARFTPLVKELKKRLGLPVAMVRLNSRKPRGVDEVIPATPFELIWLINHAALVITDSFHGAAFSINLNTPFYVLPNRKNNIRLRELLNLTGLSSRSLNNDCLPRKLDLYVDFSKANHMLAKQREKDSSWLYHAVTGEDE